MGSRALGCAQLCRELRAVLYPHFFLLGHAAGALGVKPTAFSVGFCQVVTASSRVRPWRAGQEQELLQLQIPLPRASSAIGLGYYSNAAFLLNERVKGFECRSSSPSLLPVARGPCGLLSPLGTASKARHRASAGSLGLLGTASPSAVPCGCPK